MGLYQTSFDPYNFEKQAILIDFYKQNKKVVSMRIKVISA